ncbi:MAG TPA: hypothetical protein VF426_06815 [Marmoricola sp.]
MWSHEIRVCVRWLLVALVGGSLLLSGPAWSDSATASTGEQPVDGAVLRWGLSDEANNAAFAPGTFNFFSAGKVADPGRGGTTLKQPGWKQTSGSVSIEKWLDGGWHAATWAGLSTDTTGKPLAGPLSGRFSGHQIVFSDGVGTIDRDAGTAHIAWRGDATVLSYSGMSFFYLSDPVLDVADGVGTVHGTLSGYASSQTDTSVWEPVPATEVTLADLPDISLGEDGFTVTPTYAGSFPKSWVAFMDRLGTGSFWYASGGSTDAYKAALPITVGYGSSATAPTPSPGATPTTDPIENTAPEPTATTSAASSPTPSTSAPTASTSTFGLGSDADAGDATAGLVATAPVAQLVELRAAHIDPSNSADVSDRWWWGSGAVLLALSFLVAVSSSARPRSR